MQVEEVFDFAEERREEEAEMKEEVEMGEETKWEKEEKGKCEKKAEKWEEKRETLSISKFMWSVNISHQMTYFGKA